VTEKVGAVQTKLSDTATRAKEAVTGTTSLIGDTAGQAIRVGDAIPSRVQVRLQARRAARLLQENPLGWPSAPPSAS
jgi:hypothetical protein